MKNIKYKKRLLLSLILVVLSVLFIYGNYFVNAMFLSDDSQQNKTDELRLQVEISQNSLENIQMEIDDFDIEITDFDSENYNQLLTNFANANNLSFTKFKNNEITTQNSLMSITTEFEVFGSLDDINSFLQDFDDIPCIIQNISLRQDNELLWNARSYDNTNVLSWVYIEQGVQNLEEEEYQITSEILTNQQDIHLFVEIQFIGREVI